ncbi:GNAT family N-acetyltransferase [Oceaniglobus roseus]|uniref:GNAT family N-acetyltransferase n=1 Tax=Oceaniglobus roseus TaxID=1737570 RepID=UPI000C7E9229|nr:GNAT family N-acetyltransferase [Kandeliimicrobium roseum]
MTERIAATDDLAACHALRRAVFMEEQGFSEAEEFDDLDPVCTHLLATDDGRPVGTARTYVDGTVGKIGRVCVLPSHRGTGLGARLILAALDELRQRGGLSVVRVSAQVHALPFYERFGFVAHGPEYLDGTVPHRDMDLPI